MTPAAGSRGVSDAQLEAMDPAALIDLQKRVTRRAVEVEMRPLIALRAEYDAMTAKIGKALEPYGITVDSFVRASQEELFQYMLGLAGGARRAHPAKGSSRGGTVLPRYRHPVQHDLTWTGRGAKPKWVAAYLAEDPGHNMNQLSIVEQEHGTSK